MNAWVIYTIVVVAFAIAWIAVKYYRRYKR